MSNITPDTYVSLTTPDEAVLHYGPFVEGDLAFSLTVESMKKYGEVAILRNPSVQVLADLGIAKMTDATKTIEVTNEDGRTFTVRVVEQGANYGRNDCLPHEKSEPMIEFFDKTYIEGITPLGQFVSSYYYKTLIDALYSGINLDGGVDAWHVSAENVQDALAFAYTLQQEGA